MPLAVVLEKPERHDLKTCPGGYVMVRRMSFGEKLTRRGFNSKMDLEMNRATKNAKSTIEIFNEATEIFDFMHCVVEHNLTKLVNAKTGQPCGEDDPDKKEVLLDFMKETDIKLVASQIAEEIGTIIDKLNNFEESEAVGNSSGASVPS